MSPEPSPGSEPRHGAKRASGEAGAGAALCLAQGQPGRRPGLPLPRERLRGPARPRPGELLAAGGMAEVTARAGLQLLTPRPSSALPGSFPRGYRCLQRVSLLLQHCYGRAVLAPVVDLIPEPRASCLEPRLRPRGCYGGRQRAGPRWHARNRDPDFLCLLQTEPGCEHTRASGWNTLFT